MDALTLALFLLKTTVLLMAGAALAVSLRRASAGTRHQVWLATLAGLLVLPALLRFTPLRLEVLPDLAPPETAAAASAAVVTDLAGPAPVLEPGAPAAPALEPAAASAPWSPAGAPRPSFAFSWPGLGPALLGVWVAVALSLAGWLAMGALAVRRIVRAARPLDGARWSAALCEVADRLGLPSLPRLVASDRVEMPFACGAWRATVVLPEGAEEWSEERRRLVLLHELAHVRRRDLLGHTAGRLACAAYWFHPLVWAAAKRLRMESERACDDLVLACGARASDYAEHLLDIVAAARRGGAPATALAMARRREFEGRMLAILDPAVRRGMPGRAQSLALVAGVAALFVCVAVTVPSPATAAAVPVSVDAGGAAEVSPAPAPVEMPRAAARQVARAQAEPAARPKPEPEESAPEEPDLQPAEIGQDGDNDDDESDRRREIDPARRATLIRVLRTDTDATVRRSAAWALASVRSPETSEALAGALRGDADGEVREMAAWALGHVPGEAATSALAAALQDKSAEVRATAVWALGQRRGAEVSALAAAIGDSAPNVREVAIWALGHQRVEKAPAALTAALRDGDRDIRLVAAWTLGQIHDAATVPALREAFKGEKDEEVSRALFRALLLMDRSIELIEQALASKDVELRTRAVQMLAGHRGASIVWPWPRPEPRPFP